MFYSNLRKTPFLALAMFFFYSFSAYAGRFDLFFFNLSRNVSSETVFLQIKTTKLTREYAEKLASKLDAYPIKAVLATSYGYDADHYPFTLYIQIDSREYSERTPISGINSLSKAIDENEVLIDTIETLNDSTPMNQARQARIRQDAIEFLTGVRKLPLNVAEDTYAFIERKVLGDPIFLELNGGFPAAKYYIQLWAEVFSPEKSLLPCEEENALAYFQNLKEKKGLENYIRDVRAAKLPTYPEENHPLTQELSWKNQLPLSGLSKFLDQNYSHFSTLNRLNTLELFVELCLSKPEFQKQPVRFLRDWRKKRGCFEMMTPEDPILDYLERLDENQLMYLAKVARENPVQPRKNKTP